MTTLFPDHQEIHVIDLKDGDISPDLVIGHRVRIFGNPIEVNDPTYHIHVSFIDDEDRLDSIVQCDAEDVIHIEK